MSFAGLKRSAKMPNHRAGKPAKIEIRQHVFDQIAEPRVFDGFAGAGEMYRAVWHKAHSYVGCDTRWFRDGRCAYVADNRRVMRAIDLGQFNIFDLDAFGSPWEQVQILLARRRLAPRERIGLVLTEGSMLKLKMGALPGALAELAGLSAGRLNGVHRWRDDVLERAIRGLARRFDCTIIKRWQADGTSQAQVRYLGLVLEREAAE